MAISLTCRQILAIACVLTFGPSLAGAQDVVHGVLVGTATGAGVMRALNTADGSEIAAATPFGAQFRGGLRVATGDLTGDGVPDFIVGAGYRGNGDNRDDRDDRGDDRDKRGSGRHGGGLVSVIDGADGSTVWTFSPFGGGHSGDVYVAAGDVDGDGRVDVVVGSGVGDGWLRVFSGLDRRLIATYYPFSGRHNGGVTVASADINGDGRADVIAGTAVGGSLRVFDGVTGSEILVIAPYGSHFHSGIHVAAGDVNNDGRADVVTAPRKVGREVRAFSGLDGSLLAAFTPYPRGGSGGLTVAAGDVNADGYADIITGPDTGATPDVRITSGVDHTELARFMAFDPNYRGGVFVAAIASRANGPEFTSANETTFAAGAAGTFEVATSGSRTALEQRGRLPEGVTFTDNGDGTATLAGTPAAGTGGRYPLTLTADNGAKAPATQSFTLIVNETPAISTGDGVTFTVGATGTATITTSGFPAPAIATGGEGLPAGVTVTDNGDGTATLSGTPAPGAGGLYGLTFMATNIVGTSPTHSFTLTINEAPSITSASSAAFIVGAASSSTIATRGFPTPSLTRSGIALPVGLSYVDNGDGTGTLSGTPGASTGGVYAIAFTAGNGVGPAATQNFALTINQAPVITTGNSTTFPAGVARSFILAATGFPAPALSQTGSLPAGITFTPATGMLSGIATDAGVYALQFRAANGVGADAVQNFTLTIGCPALSITPAGLADGRYQAAYAPLAFSLAGASGMVTWTATGLPPGLAINTNTGVLAGTPLDTMVGGAVVITATDRFGCEVTRQLSLTIRPTADDEVYSGGVGHTPFAVGVAVLTPNVFVDDSVSVGDAGPGPLDITFPPASAHGTIVEGPADGTFVYTPNLNFAGPSDSFTYTLTDGNGITATGTVTINLANVVWYVNSAGPNGDGRSHNPFNNLTNAGMASTSGQFIYVHSGGPTTTGLLLMDANQTVQGAGASFSLNGLSLPAGLPPTLTSTVTLANNTAVVGLNFAGTTPAIRALSVSQPVAIDRVNVTGGTNALTLTNVTGPVTVSHSSFVNTTGAEVLIFGGSGVVNIDAVISSSAGRSVEVTNRTGGLVIFSRPIADTGTGIFLNANNGATVNFTGGISLSTGAATAFTATGGGTVNVVDPDGPGNNRIATTTGRAINVSNTRIGASGLTFESISVNGAVNGIVLNGTGGGSLTVTGTGEMNSGGTIQNAFADAILLTNTGPVNLEEMDIIASGQSHIDATAVSGLSLSGVDTDLSIDHGIRGNGLANLVVRGGTFHRGGAGAEPRCNVHGVYITNLLGTSSITGTTFTGSNSTQLLVNNTAATVAAPNPPADVLTVSGTTWNAHAGPCRAGHLSVHADSGGNFKLVVLGASGENTFEGGGAAVQATAAGTGAMQASITAVDITASTVGVVIGAAGASSAAFNVFDNNTGNGTGFSGTGGTAAMLTCTTSGVCQGAFSNNTISHTAGAGVTAIQVVVEGDGAGLVTVANNGVSGNYQRGFHGLAGAGTGLGSLSLHLTGNRFDGSDAGGVAAVDLASSLTGDDTVMNTICLNLTGNTASPAPGAQAYRITNSGNDVFGLQAFAGNGSSVADVQNWVTAAGGNVGAPVEVAMAAPYQAVASCPTPTLPMP